MKKRLASSFKITTILLFLIILFAYAMFQGGFVSWFLFFGSLPIFFYMGFLLIYPMSRLKLGRHIKHNIIEAGNHVQIEVTFKRDAFFPMYFCIIEDIMPETINYRDTKQKKFAYLGKPDALKEKQGAKKIIFPWFKRSFSFTYTLKHVPRGEHVINQIRVVTGDFTGIVRKEKIFDVETKLHVYPAQRKLTLRKQAESFEEGASHSFNRTLKKTTVVSGVRNYAPGDRVSWIDWKASARRNEMMTKEFEQEKSHDMLILLDGTHYENMNWLSFEGAVEVAHSLIYALRDESARLVFSTLSVSRQAFPINHDQLGNSKIKQLLSTIKPLPSIPFARLIKQEVGNLPQGFSYMIVTTKMTPELQDTLMQLKLRSPRVVLFLVTPMNSITLVEQEIMKKLSNNGIVLNVLTEEKLIKQSFEVNA